MSHVPQRMPGALRRLATPRERLPSWLDCAIVAVVLTLSLAHAPRLGAGGVVLTIALVAPLLWRHRAPVAVFALIWAAAAGQWLAAGPVFADVALLIAFFTVAGNSELRTTALVGAALELGIVLAMSWHARGADSWLKGFVGLSGLATAAGLVAINLGNRRRAMEGLRERAERLERERERELQLATVTERARIAREMHDVVAHNLSVMVALCDGAAYHVDAAPERVRSALEQAARTGRQALAEMRQLVGVLREPSSPDLAPQPGIRQVEELIEQVRAAGVPVSYQLAGVPTGAPAGLELAIYRIVQEALTNALKHAGADARVSVALTCAENTIEVEVRDTGETRPGGGGGGAGLRGMHERAALYGGTLAAGPSERGGWLVHARLQVPAAELTGVP